MTAHATINTALAFPGLLPMDGYCACDRCGTTELNRDDMHTVEPHEQIARRAAKHGTHFCAQCIDLMYYAADDAANPHMRKESPAPCPHHQEQCGGRDYVTGKQRTQFCAFCDGRGVPA